MITGEGVVIARNTTGVADPDGVTWIGSSRGSNSSKSREHAHPDAELESGHAKPWILVQTNYDLWLPDNPDDPRRTVAEATLASLGQTEAAGALGLFAVAGTYPVHNPSTAYTAVMDVRLGTLHAFVRQALCPIAAELDQRYC